MDYLICMLKVIIIDTLTNNLGKVYENANVSFKPWPDEALMHINTVLDIIMNMT